MFKLFVLFILVAMSSCGYTTRGTIYKEKTIVITPAVNKIDVTLENRDTAGYANFPLLLENRLTNTLVSKFNIDGNLKVVSQDPRALNLTCAIVNYEKEALRYTSAADVEEQRLRLYVEMKLTSPEGKILVEKTAVGETSYFLSGPSQKSETAAQADLVEDTARRIYEAVIQQW